MLEDHHKQTAIRVIYHGRVQGVGFRVTTAHLARGFPIVGWVRNLPDGTVELLAQGPPQGVQDFLTKVATQFEANILQADEFHESQVYDIHGFTVRE